MEIQIELSDDQMKFLKILSAKIQMKPEEVLSIMVSLGLNHTKELLAQSPETLSRTIPQLKYAS